MTIEIRDTDVLIIGAGMAGCRAALEAHDRGARVTITTKGLLTRDGGATWMASTGYQCWGISPRDSLDVQVEDTLRCGWFLNNQENVYAYLSHIPDTALELIKWGCRFRMKDGKLSAIWQLGCSTEEGRSIIPGTFPVAELGFNFARAFYRQIQARPRIVVHEDTFILDLLRQDNRVVGAIGIDSRTGKFCAIRSKLTVLATGGYQALHKATTANPTLTGDGHAIALRAGVDVMDFEFNQTLPTALWPPEVAGFTVPFKLLLYFNGRMYNNQGERFMSKWDPIKMERSTRAMISRGIYHEIREGRGSERGGIYTSAAHESKSFIEAHLKEYEGTITGEKIKRAGIDLTRDSVETAYALHYCQGGCNVNARCETDVPGLYAIGEVASGGKDGADRMMSNALPYCMAMGVIVGQEAAAKVHALPLPEIDEVQIEEVMARALAPFQRNTGTRVFDVRGELQDLMARETGYGRTEEGLRFALREIERYKDRVVPELHAANKSRKLNLEWLNVLEFQNQVLVAECIIRNALLRTESRGLHDRWDFVNPSTDCFKNNHLRLVKGELRQWQTPVDFTYWKPKPGSLGQPWDRGVKIKDYEGFRSEPVYTRM